MLTKHQRKLLAGSLALTTLNVACVGEIGPPYGGERRPEIDTIVVETRAVQVAQEAIQLAKQKIVGIASEHDRWHNILRRAFGEDFNYWDAEYYRKFYIHQPDLLGQPVRFAGIDVLEVTTSAPTSISRMRTVSSQVLSL